MKEQEKINIPESLTSIKKDQPIYFEKEGESPKVFEVVNILLEPYGYEDVSEGQFKHVAGGSSNSSNIIKNYATGKGAISGGFTYITDIINYCQESLNNSVVVPLDEIVSTFHWAKEAINKKFITLYSGRKNRYDIQAMMDITKGHLSESAFKIDCQNHGIEIELDREFYAGTSNTDEGQDVKKIKFPHGDFIAPKIKVQIKDVQYFMLVSKGEFDGNRSAQLFIGYRVHWKKATTGQRFFRSLGGKGEEIFSDFPVLTEIRVERRGWALREDFKDLPSKTKQKGMSFDDDNMFVYWDKLRRMTDLFPVLASLIG